jgi:hypothetical protein
MKFSGAPNRNCGRAPVKLPAMVAPGCSKAEQVLLVLERLACVRIVAARRRADEANDVGNRSHRQRVACAGREGARRRRSGFCPVLLAQKGRAGDDPLGIQRNFAAVKLGVHAEGRLAAVFRFLGADLERFVDPIAENRIAAERRVSADGKAHDRVAISALAHQASQLRAERLGLLIDDRLGLRGTARLVSRIDQRQRGAARDPVVASEGRHFRASRDSLALRIDRLLKLLLVEVLRVVEVARELFRALVRRQRGEGCGDALAFLFGVRHCGCALAAVELAKALDAALNEIALDLLQRCPHVGGVLADDRDVAEVAGASPE